MYFVQSFRKTGGMCRKIPKIFYEKYEAGKGLGGNRRGEGRRKR